MLTLEKLTAAAQELPAEFSLGQLVDKLVMLEKQPLGQEDAHVFFFIDSTETATQLTRESAWPTIKSLRGIAAGLPLEDLQKSAKEWEAERIREKYGV